MTLIIYISDAGRSIALKLMRELPYSHISPYKALTVENFQRSKSFIFVGAMGDCVRAIAPYIDTRHLQPDVLCVDNQGHHVVSVFSGHIGGANKLTRRVARILGADPVITTQGDNDGMWSLDTLAAHFGWQEEHHGGRMSELLAHYVAGRPTALLLDIRGDRGVDYLRRTCAPFVKVLEPGQKAPKDCLQVSVSPYLNCDEVEDEKEPARAYPRVTYRPPVLHLGVGCLTTCSVGTLPKQIVRLLHENGLSEKSIATIDTIPMLEKEALLLALQEAFPWAKLKVHSPEELKDQPAPNPSDFALRHAGIPSVSEAAAMMYGPLLIEKTKLGTGRGPNAPLTCTVALSISRSSLLGGHVEVVGAGPGDPSLISVQGMQVLQQADLILYPVGNVSERLTHYAHIGCEVRSSVGMTLQQQLQLIQQYYDRGLQIVLLLPGNPETDDSIQPQLDLLKSHGLRLHITPGIS